MRAAVKFFLEESMLLALAKEPLTTSDIRAKVSGTRGDIVDTLVRLKQEDRLETDASVPRKWKLKGISYE